MIEMLVLILSETHPVIYLGTMYNRAQSFSANCQKFTRPGYQGYDHFVVTGISYWHKIDGNYLVYDSHHIEGWIGTRVAHGS